MLGEVAPGLLVFSGQHSRLSNVVEEGKFISTEVFIIGDKEIPHTQGQVCKPMKPFVALRSEFPDLFGKISIMTQPASNLDGILMKWVAMGQAENEPCGINIKDSFSANFASETCQAEHICNIATAHSLGHMTAQLEVADTHCSRAFQHQFRKEFDEARMNLKKQMALRRASALAMRR